MTTTENAVQAIASFFRDLERDQRRHIQQARTLIDSYQAIHDNGDAEAMVTMSAFADLDALVTANYAATLALHSDQTAAAKERNIDVGPLPDVGDKEGGIQPRSGGR